MFCRPLFASSLLVVVRTLLQQARHEEMQILGCNILVDFIKAQVQFFSVARSGYLITLSKFTAQFDEPFVVGSEEAFVISIQL